MKLLHFDCAMGAAGDMLTAALLELFENPEKAVEELNSLGIPGVRFRAEKSEKCGIAGTHMQVFVGDVQEHELDHEHSHSGMAQISHIISHLNISQSVRDHVLAVYDLIARAESHVHGTTVEQVHFHEVGAMDAIADITAFCYLLDKLKVEKVTASPVHVGAGQVKCAHGLLPVPAPATAELLKGVPVYGGQITGELCTPTGAALLKHFAAEFGPMPAMTLIAAGYGMGRKDFPAANCVRAMLGESSGLTDTVLALSCNLDDMTAEEIGFATEELLAQGALDVFTTPIGMKKNRPGTQLTVLCHPEQRACMVRTMFRHTTTLGIREAVHSRYTLSRHVETTETPYGPVQKKCASGYGVKRSKLEYEDLARIAREHDLPLRDLPKFE